MTTDTTFVVPPSPTGIYTVSVGTGGSGGTLGSISGVGGGGITGRRASHMIVDDLNHFIKDHEIQGQTLTVEHTRSIYSDIPFSKEDEAVIKAELMEKMVHELFKAKCIEFTRMKAADSDEMVYRARIHVVPDTQVRIIRELKSAK
jgi:hypothetical protein